MRILQYFLKNKTATLILFSSLFLGVLVRTQNLFNARFFYPDEYRTVVSYQSYTFFLTPFLSFVYSIPLSIFGYYHDVALYTSAFWGTLSILMVFVIGKVLFNEKVGAYSALILSLFATHVVYSRSGLPAIFQSFLFLAAFLFLVLFFKSEERKYSYIILAGIFLGLTFLAYAVSYAPIAAIFLLCLMILKIKRKSLKEILKTAVLLGGAILLPFILFGIFVEIHSYLKIYPSYGFKYYLGFLFDYQERGVLSRPYSLTDLLAIFVKVSANGGIFQLSLIIIGFIFGVIYWFRKKDNNLLLLLGFIGLSYLIFTIMGLLGFSSIHPRKYLYIIPFLCISSAYLLYIIERVTNKYIVIAFLVIFSIFSFPKYTEIIKGTFKIKPITNWLRQNNIKKNQVISRLDLSWEREDTQMQETLPVKVIFHAVSPKGYAYNEYKIEWEKIKKLYYQNKIRYILTGGIGTAYKTADDPVFKKIKPLKTWVIRTSLSVETPVTTDILNLAIYDLKDIFPDSKPFQINP